jgi:hypothetical protein
MSYGVDLSEMYRQVGIYAGQVVKGVKPADLPIMQADQVRTRHQRQDGQNARTDHSLNAARQRRRGDRIGVLALLRLALLRHADDLLRSSLLRAKPTCDWPLVAQSRRS